MNKKSALTLTYLVSAVASLAGPAAADTSVFPGAICLGTGGAAPLVNGEGAVRNPDATQALELECPLTRAHGTTTGSVISDTSVWVINPGPSNNSVSCTLSVEDNDSGATLAQVTRSTTLISSQLQELNFPVMSGAPFAAFHLSCTLPPNLQPVGASVLRNISVEEP